MSIQVSLNAHSGLIECPPLTSVVVVWEEAEAAVQVHRRGLFRRGGEHTAANASHLWGGEVVLIGCFQVVNRLLICCL